MDVATTHLSADLDGLASLVALRLLEPGIELVLPGSMEATTRRFWEEQQRSLPALLSLPELRSRLEGGERPGRMLVADTADPARIGPLAELAPRFESVLAFDTHPTAEGDLPRAPMPRVAACTSAFVMKLDEAGLRPTPEQAGLFALGIHQDSGHFTFPGTRPLDLVAAARCMEWGAPMEWIERYVPKGYTSRQLELLEEMSRSAVHAEIAGIPVVLLSLDLPGYEAELSVLLEQLRAAEDWPAAFLLAGSGDRVDVIGRGDDAVDVAAVMRRIGGGGHRDAGSAVLSDITIREAQAILRSTLEETLGNRRRAGELATRDFLRLPARASIRDAGELIHQRRIDSLPLTKGKGAALEYVGVVTRREVDAALRHGLGDRPAGELAAFAPAWIPADASVAEARERLIEGPSRLLLVGDPPGGAVGILTRGAVFRALEEPTAGRRIRPPSAESILDKVRTGLGERWELVESLGAIAGEWGRPLHLVGGTVRDLLLGLPVRDVDLVLEGDAPRLAAEARRRFGGEVEVHEAFGTACWIGPSRGDRGERASTSRPRASSTTSGGPRSPPSPSTRACARISSGGTSPSTPSRSPWIRARREPCTTPTAASPI
ncbi:tRNA nucleotidyltransferase, A-adding [Vulgatibacter incomptus]|uniref:tRNA nucleotidyltransferase, A-adding n=1 Tax=Vulgatibacter incomptus TaxID=1391653 RepID=A0A0K1PFJ5_9BACT|nr:CBS domain-containing protein [Vulgatibacter incomptus]AKU92201.1 tRNA nucleotidyltransferase, A-adding [Vulgatibacter incomptus]